MIQQAWVLEFSYNCSFNLVKSTIYRINLHEYTDECRLMNTQTSKYRLIVNIVLWGTHLLSTNKTGSCCIRGDSTVHTESSHYWTQLLPLLNDRVKSFKYDNVFLVLETLFRNRNSVIDPGAYSTCNHAQGELTLKQFLFGLFNCVYLGSFITLDTKQNYGYNIRWSWLLKARKTPRCYPESWLIPMKSSGQFIL